MPTLTLSATPTQVPTLTVSESVSSTPSGSPSPSPTPSPTPSASLTAKIGTAGYEPKFGILSSKEKFMALATYGQEAYAPIVRAKIDNVMRRKAETAVFRDVDCVQSDPTGTQPDKLCYTVCTITAYKDELGANYSRINPFFPDLLARGGRDMMAWIVANGRWLDSINSQLPEFVTVSSQQIYEDCNYEKVVEHLWGMMWRVQLLDGTTLTKLDIQPNGYEVAMPLEAPYTDVQDCKLKDPSRGDTWRRVPRSSISGYCMTDNIDGWSSATDPNIFPPANPSPFPWWLLRALLLWQQGRCSSA
jgi:hypothetical protein